MGLFFYTKKGSIISTVDLPTTEIIEPLKSGYLIGRKLIILTKIRVRNRLLSVHDKRVH